MVVDCPAAPWRRTGRKPDIVPGRCTSPPSTSTPRAATPTRSRSASSRARSLRRRRPPQLGELLASGEARRSFKALALTHAEGKRWLLVGLGAREDFTPERARVAAAAAGERAREISTPRRCAGRLPRRSDAGDRRGARARARSSATTASSATSRPPPTERVAADEPPKHLERLIVAGADGLEAAVAEATLIGEAVNRARDLQNRPGNDLTPTALAEYATALGAEIEGVSVEVEGREGILARGMGAFAAVAQGSEQEPALITLRYDGPPAPGARDGRRPDARLRRQGGDVRQRRHLAEAGGEDGRDEVRHVRRRRRDRGGRPRSRA